MLSEVPETTARAAGKGGWRGMPPPRRPGRSHITVGGANGMGAAVLRHTSRKISLTERARRLGEDVGVFGPAALISGLRRSCCPRLK